MNLSIHVGSPRVRGSDFTNVNMAVISNTAGQVMAVAVDSEDGRTTMILTAGDKGFTELCGQYGIESQAVKIAKADM